jgi:predicted RecA/RadA family phage recombinase
MQNYISKGDTLTLVAPSAVNSGDGIIINGLFVVAAADIASGEKGAFIAEGVVELAKDTATAFALGEAVEWETAGSKLVAAAAGNLDAGYCVEAVGAAATTAKIKLARSGA